MSCNCATNCSPPIRGITTSVMTRSIGPLCPCATSRAWYPPSASRTRDRLVNADTGSADAEHDVVAWGYVHQPAGVVAVELRIGGLDGQYATVWHRVPGVRGKVEDDLLDETVVGPDRYHIPGQPPGQF